MFDRHSIFFKLNLFFAFALVTLALLFAFFHHNAQLHEIRRVSQRGMELGRLLYHTRTVNMAQRIGMLKEAQFELIDPSQLPATAVRLVLPQDAGMRRRPFALYSDGDTYYFRSRSFLVDFVVKDSRPPEGFGGMQVIFLVLLIGLITLYGMLRQSLVPLGTLTEKIRRFAGGDMEIDTASDRRDEIAVISNEFNDAARQLRQLLQSRQLFLRNIMHELKTPLTRGKLALAMMEQDEQVQYLDRLFNRMDALINQLARIEQLQSSQLSKEPLRARTLVEEAIARLYLEEHEEETVTVEALEEMMLQVDRELFTSALTNLIDNAIKYADTLPVTVRIDREGLCISNHGAPMPDKVENYFQPFVRGTQEAGLGLGLSIADTVVKAHGFDLAYGYEEGWHRFCIRFAVSGG